MINPKNICVSACIGFFLSFLIGLFSDVNFSAVLLRALLFGLLFAALCVGISFLFQKFLAADNGGFSPEPDSPLSRAATGNVVNIVIDDSNLPDEDMAPKFTVSETHSNLHKNKTPPAAPKEGGAFESAAVQAAASSEPSSAEPAISEPVAAPSAESVSSSSAANAAFKPVSLGDVTQKTDSAPVSSETAQPLDELPDISDMPTTSSDVASELDSPAEEIVSDSEFATGGAKMKEQPVSGDTAVMAKAIQTLLAKDN